MNPDPPLFSPHHKIRKSDRVRHLGQRPLVIWFTGLSGSGKSTLAGKLEEELFKRGFKTMLLDGDILRQGLNKDLGFDDNSRKENIRRIGECCRLFNDAGLVTITSFISPFREERNWVRSLFPTGEFIEVFVDTPLEICEARDPNGLYKMAREGKIKNFTGIDSAYEAPLEAELTLDAANIPLENCVQEILDVTLGRIMEY